MNNMTGRKPDNQKQRPFAPIIDRLRNAGLRPTRQRLALARLLLEHGQRHITAESLHEEALREGIKVSLATVYNSLHQFTEAGLLHEVVVDPGKSYFDTNTSEHHHFYCPETGEISDIPGNAITLPELPSAPDGYSVGHVDVIIRLKKQDAP